MSTTTISQAVQDSLDYTIFSWSKQAGLQPIEITSAKGVWLHAGDGKKYIDFSSQLINVNIGHGHPKVAAAVMAQMNEVSYVYPGMVTGARGRLGKLIAEVAPANMKKTFFTLGGSEANENAMKLTRLLTGRHKIIALYRSYHGATIGAISLSGDPRRHQVDSQGVPNIFHVENPYFYRCPWNSRTPEECGELAAAHMERVIQYQGPETIAAIFMEGESGTSGCIKYPPNYWRLVRQIADKYGIMLVADEVMSGFARTGKWFGVDNHGVEPDIITFAKGVTAGYLPLGGMIVSAAISDRLDNMNLPLGLTYSAHPVSCAAGAAVLEIYKEEGLVEKAASMGRYLDKRVEDLKAIHPSIGDWRNTGLLGCFELVKNRETRAPMAPFNAKPEQMAVMNQVAAKIRELGMYTFVRWNYVFVAPPLNVTVEEMEHGLDILSQAISVADAHYQG
jgi:taurine---2-oxoglutarate transaminase